MVSNVLWQIRLQDVPDYFIVYVFADLIFIITLSRQTMGEHLP